MGMIFTARRLTPAQVRTLDTEPHRASELMFAEGAPAELDLDKAWHGIHFLLTGSAWETTPGMGETILGGEPVGPDNGYGPARLLRADDVRTAAAELAALSVPALRSRFDAAAMAEQEELYPQIWDEEDVFESYVAPYYTELQQFYARAAAESESVLMCVS